MYTCETFGMFEHYKIVVQKQKTNGKKNYVIQFSDHLVLSYAGNTILQLECCKACASKKVKFVKLSNLSN